MKQRCRQQMRLRKTLRRSQLPMLNIPRRHSRTSQRFISKLTSLKSPDEVMKLQADYAKSAYETFVAESKKISELYTDFAKQTFKPFEGLIAKMTPAK